MTRQLFVYWKTGAAHAAAAGTAVAACQQALRLRHPGLAARLYRRAGHRDDGSAGGEVTLMETYAAPGGIGTALQAEIVAAGRCGSAPWRRGEYVVEIFDEFFDE